MGGIEEIIGRSPKAETPKDAEPIRGVIFVLLWYHVYGRKSSEIKDSIEAGNWLRM